MADTIKEMKLIDIDELIPYAGNSRTHTHEQINKIRSSLREFGFINPVIIDKDNGIIAGHGRVDAARAEGIKQVPCVLADHLTEAQKKAYVIADNRLAEDAGWDEEMLRAEIEALQGEDFDLMLTGFDEQEIADLFKTDDDVEEDNFDVDAELEKETFTKAGDVWTLGRHRLVCGDSTKEETYNVLMQGKKEEVAKAVLDAGYDPYEKKLLGITAMSNLLGKKQFEEILGGLVYKPPGKPALVPESDKRPEMNSAAEDFNDK